MAASAVLVTLCVAAAADSRPRSLDGVVVDAGGKPVAGADVYFATTTLGGSEVSTQTRSGPDGRFRLAVPERWLDAPGKVRLDAGVIAFKDGLGISALGVRLSGILPPTSIRLGLGGSPGAKAAIRVLDPGGKPVASAKVSVSALAADALCLGCSEDNAQEFAEATRQTVTSTPAGPVIGKMQVPLPEVLRRRLSALTDGDGNVVVAGIARREIAGVAVLSEKFGSQDVSRMFADFLAALQLAQIELVGLIALDEFPASISLQPVGSLAGRLSADGGGAGRVALTMISPINVSGEIPMRHDGHADVTTDAQGQFSVPALPAGMTVVLVKMPNDSPLRPVMAKSWTQIEPGKRAEISIPLKRAIRATGIVRDAESGKPIPGVALDITSGGNCFAETVRTDAAGRFQCLVAPGEIVELPALPEGFVRVVSPRCLNMATAEVPAGKETYELPPIELSHTVDPVDAKTAPKKSRIDPKRYRVLAGRVVDRQGKPVAGATVFQSLAGPEAKAAATGADGRFRLDGIWEGKSLVFARKKGFRLAGQVIDGLPQSTELPLARSTEPPRRILKTLPPAMPHAERLVLARKLIEPAVKQALAAKDDKGKMPILLALGRVDPSRLLQLLDAKAVPNAESDQMLRASAAAHLAKECPDEAQAILESMSDVSDRSMAYFRLIDASPTAERKLELLGQALVRGRAITEPWLRVCNLSLVGKRLIDLGRVDQATKVLREAEAVAKQLSVSDSAGYARGVAATELAPVDLTAALELIKGLTDPSEYIRHHGDIAHKIAGKQPAEAERVLGMIRTRDDDGFSKDRFAVRVCYRMAMIDLPRARKIAAQIKEPYYKAQVYGVMAQAIGATQPAVALGLLRDAISGLAGHVRSGNDEFNGVHNASSVAASLLSVVEKIAPNLVDEFLWQAVAFRHTGPGEAPGSAEGDPRSASRAQEADLHLAAMIARYDRELAGLFFEPAWKAAIPKKLAQPHNLLIVAALLRPHEAAMALEKSPDGAETIDARCRLAGALARDDEIVWGHLQGRLLGLWRVDDEDLEECMDD